MGILYETYFGVFLILLCALGGGAAWMTGRACANTWRPLWVLCWFLFLLTLAIRFLTFALFEGTLLSVQFLVVDYLVLLGFGLAGWRFTRTKQMTTQYVWLYEKTGPFTWRLREGQTDRYAEG
ncbi:hypothetical protein E1178_16175 [Roseibium hamelinense]|nr:hypothetical protein [Roseibium hamelinense]MTI45144.1 hypothetical protein [Roseibium hamelinense]